MKLLFIDETAKYGYFGISIVCMDHTKYSLIGTSILNALNKHQWSLDKEFKSTCIFSSTEGCPQIDIETRRKIAKEIIRSNISGSNARINAYFAYTKGNKNTKNYQLLLKKILSQLPRASSSKNGKNLIAVFFDQLDLGNEAIKEVITSLSVLAAKDYLLLEHPTLVKSSNITHGIFLADHIAFISLWKSISDSDKDLEKKPIKKMKDKFIKELFTDIKKIKITEVKTNVSN